MKKQLNNSWHLIDAKNKILGRLSSEVAQFLSGKQNVAFEKHIDHGDHVVIINAKDITLTGKKEIQKKYYKHSGYPGGLKVKTAFQVKEKRPEQIIRHAVIGMLPKNKIGKQMVKKLYVYADDKHPHQDKFKSN